MPDKLLQFGAALAFCLALGGCAGSGELFTAENARPEFINKSMLVQEAQDALAVGVSTKADVLAALGIATVISFDGGHEVWAYRGKPLKAAATGAEFVSVGALTHSAPALDLALDFPPAPD